MQEETLMLVNLNDDIKVKLTDFGKEIFYKKLDEFDKRLVSSALLEEDENGWTKFQLWEFMNIYGKYLYNGATKLPIEGTQVFIEKWVI